jgi:hypothetical protein
MVSLAFPHGSELDLNLLMELHTPVEVSSNLEVPNSAYQGILHIREYSLRHYFPNFNPLIVSLAHLD